MSVSFNLIPQGLLTPGVFNEFDTSRAQQGPAIQEYDVLLVGQKLSSGTKAAGSIDLVTSASQGRQFYGPGSMLAAMIANYFSENKGVNSLFCIALDDAGAAVKASGSIDFGGAATAEGVVSYFIAGRLYKISVAATDTDTDICAAFVAAIAADADRQVDAAVNGVDDTICDLTARNGGEVGNSLDIRRDKDQELPAGVTASITAFSSGATNPDVDSVITAMGDEQYHVIGCPYVDSSNLGKWETELDDRWGPLRQIDGQYVSARRDTVSNQSTFANGRNNEHETFFDCIGASGPHEWAGALAGVIAREGQSDPARPMQTVEVTSVLAPEISELRSRAERQQLLSDGISTVTVNAGSVFIERVRTTRKTDNLGTPDPSLADLNPKLILSYLRFSFRVRVLLRYPRHKLADDGTRFAPGQLVATPGTIRADIVALFREWESIGLVEGADQFKRDLVVVRNAQDPTRVDIDLPPDLINQYRVTAAKTSFLL